MALGWCGSRDSGKARLAWPFDNLGEVVLRPSIGGLFTPPTTCRAAAGLALRGSMGTGTSVRQVWLRSPQDGIFSISTFGTDSYINAVSNGQVMFVSGGDLHLGRPGMTPALIAPFADGRKVYDCKAAITSTSAVPCIEWWCSATTWASRRVLHHQATPSLRGSDRHVPPAS